MLSNASLRKPRSRPAAKRAYLPESSTAAVLSSIDLQARAGEAAALLKALANPDRLLLLCQLVGGERSVSDLGLSTDIEQPSLSQQLGVLRGERLVATRREGKQVFYRIASPAALTVLEALYGLFCNPAKAAPSAKAGAAPRRSPDRTATRPRRRIA
jgi:ArsR family transcriptional regulator